MKKTTLCVLLNAAIFAVALNTAQAKEYTATHWLPATDTLNSEPYQKWAPEVEEGTNGEISFKIFSSGALMSPKSTMQGLKNGVAQVGIVYSPYTPSELPLTSMLTDLVIASDDDIAAAFAWTEINIENEQLQNEWSKNGGIFGGGYSTPVYNLVCVKPIHELADANGLKIRTAGAAQSEWVKALGAIPVSVPSVDIYTGLERGSIDCTLSDPTNLSRALRLAEVAKSVNVLPQGVVLGATYVYNKDFWKKLSPENRRVLLDTMAHGLARSQVGYHVGAIEAYEYSKDQGLEIIEPSDDLQAKFDEFKSDYIQNLPKKAMEDKKIADPTEIINEYLELENKWKDLLKDTDRTDEGALYQVLYENLYKNIDENTYGL